MILSVNAVGSNKRYIKNSLQIPRYIDLTSACDLPLQVAMCFLSAALWMWRALELLGDNCGGDAWLDMYIFEDIWAAPPASKRLAMQYSDLDHQLRMI